MPKGATLVNTARKEVIDEAGVIQAMTEREDLKYITDIAPDEFCPGVFITTMPLAVAAARSTLS